MKNLSSKEVKNASRQTAAPSSSPQPQEVDEFRRQLLKWFVGGTVATILGGGGIYLLSDGDDKETQVKPQSKAPLPAQKQADPTSLKRKSATEVPANRQEWLEQQSLTDQLIGKIDQGFPKFCEKIRQLAEQYHLPESTTSYLMRPWQSYEMNKKNPYRNLYKADGTVKGFIKEYFYYKAFPRDASEHGQRVTAFFAIESQAIVINEDYDQDSFFDNMRVWHELNHKSQSYREISGFKTPKEFLHYMNFNGERAKKNMQVLENEAESYLGQGIILDLFLEQSVTKDLRSGQKKLGLNSTFMESKLKGGIKLSKDELSDIDLYVKVLLNQHSNLNNLEIPSPKLIDFIKTFIERDGVHKAIHRPTSYVQPVKI